MSGGVNKRLLLKARLSEGEVDLPDVGVVRVRALSRADVLALKATEVDGDRAALERRMLSMAMVDPVLTEDEVGQWQQVSTAGEFEQVVRKVNELSGLGRPAAKDAYKEFEADPDAEFRVLPSGEARDDGGPDAVGDAER